MSLGDVDYATPYSLGQTIRGAQILDTVPPRNAFGIDIDPLWLTREMKILTLPVANAGKSFHKDPP